jgi:hypothetical protein
MRVLIDGVEYVPMPTPIATEGLQGALELRFDSDAGDNITIRDYLRILLETVWEEREGFSGKRPFGNSGWEYDLYEPLVRGGYVAGNLDEDEYIEVVDRQVADAYVLQLIKAAFAR